MFFYVVSLCFHTLAKLKVIFYIHLFIGIYILCTMIDLVQPTQTDLIVW